MNLKIECEGIADVSARHRVLEIELQDVDLGFLEDIKISELIKYREVKEVLDALDSDDIIDYLEEKFGLENLVETKYSLKSR